MRSRVLAVGRDPQEAIAEIMTRTPVTVNASAPAMEALRCPPSDAPVNNLSGGERRRVALAKLLLSEPDLLRADMDALPVREQTGDPFASTNGLMHARTATSLHR